jgi:hypothetical protein
LIEIVKMDPSLPPEDSIEPCLISLEIPRLPLVDDHGHRFDADWFLRYMDMTANFFCENGQHMECPLRHPIRKISIDRALQAKLQNMQRCLKQKSITPEKNNFSPSVKLKTHHAYRFSMLADFLAPGDSARLDPPVLDLTARHLKQEYSPAYILGQHDDDDEMSEDEDHWFLPSVRTTSYGSPELGFYMHVGGRVTLLVSYILLSELLLRVLVWILQWAKHQVGWYEYAGERPWLQARLFLLVDQIFVVFQWLYRLANMLVIGQVLQASLDTLRWHRFIGGLLGSNPRDFVAQESTPIPQNPTMDVKKRWAQEVRRLARRIQQEANEDPTMISTFNNA